MKFFFTTLRVSKPRQNFPKRVDLVVEGCPKRPGFFETLTSANRSTKWNKEPVSALR
jgi:hypothetical protein